jgi:hypothetical protein
MNIDEIQAALDAFEAVLDLPPTTYELEDGKNAFLAAIMPSLGDLLAAHRRQSAVLHNARMVANYLDDYGNLPPVLADRLHDLQASLDALDAGTG